MARYTRSFEDMAFAARREQLYTKFIISINNRAATISYSRMEDFLTKYFLHTDLSKLLKQSEKELRNEITHNQSKGKITKVRVNVYQSPKHHMYPVCINHTKIEMKFETVTHLQNFISAKQKTKTLMLEKYSQQTEACEQIERCLTQHLKSFGLSIWKENKKHTCRRSS